MFNKQGALDLCKVDQDNFGWSLTTASVVYHSVQNAQTDKREFDGQKILNSTISVEFAKTKQCWVNCVINFLFFYLSIHKSDPECILGFLLSFLGLCLYPCTLFHWVRQILLFLFFLKWLSKTFHTWSIQCSLH